MWRSLSGVENVSSLSRTMLWRFLRESSGEVDLPLEAIYFLVLDSCQNRDAQKPCPNKKRSEASFPISGWHCLLVGQVRLSWRWREESLINKGPLNQVQSNPPLDRHSQNQNSGKNLDLTRWFLRCCASHDQQGTIDLLTFFTKIWSKTSAHGSFMT